MCGITGFFTPYGFDIADAQATLISMRDRLIHRGPDDSGSWLDAEAGIALGHRRLSIVDLSPAGHQPMVSRSGRYVIVFNGEIYNHREIRHKLDVAGCVNWRGYSDTESLLEAIDSWGLETALKASVGMFALALWDRDERQLSLARDRIGEKPLYYGWQNGVLLFSSELKSLKAHHAFESQIDRDVIPLYFRSGYIPAPCCIWKDIRKLEPGTWIDFQAKDSDRFPSPNPYWSLPLEAIKGQSLPFCGSENDAVDELERLLFQSISAQQISDVPLGAFLSGGVDSSVVVALMQSQASSKSVKTFSIGFEDSAYNEAEYAKAVAAHFGTEHTELYVTERSIQQVIPQLPSIYDEPFGDHSSIPTFLLSQLAKQEVTVSLSGDGGDELFGGYGNYSIFDRWYNRVLRLPKKARSISASILRTLPLTDGKRYKRRAALLADLLEAEHPSAFFSALKQRWLLSEEVLRSSNEKTYWSTNPALEFDFKTPLDHALIADMMTYLPDDILVKVDRAAMSNSLEIRVPLLDHRIVEYSLSLPNSLKTRSGHEKWVLRQLLYRYMPRNLVDRPKMGFSMPIGQLLKGPLRDWAQDLLDPIIIREQGLLNHKSINHKWSEHVNDVAQWDSHLWLVLMFQAWINQAQA